MGGVNDKGYPRILHGMRCLCCSMPPGCTMVGIRKGVDRPRRSVHRATGVLRFALKGPYERK